LQNNTEDLFFLIEFDNALSFLEMFNKISNKIEICVILILNSFFFLNKFSSSNVY